MWSGSHGRSGRRLRRLGAGAAGAILLAVGAMSPTGASSQAIATGETTADHTATLRSIKDLIAAHYVFEALREPLATALDTSEARGRYDVADPDQFASRVTEDFQSVTRDGHLYLRRDPARYAAMLATPDSGDALDALSRARAIRRNHGLVEMSVRPENIRYLRLTNFDWVADGSTARAYDAAAAFLAEGDAVILDLRGNGGGQSDAADYALRTLLGVRPVETADRTPLYLLVDGDTGSAAEAVAYDTKVRGTAVLVGAPTYGAANNVRHFPVAPDFILSMSYKRPIHPITGANWEGVGVIPDIAAEPALALEVAELQALERLSASSPDGSAARTGYVWRAEGVRARLEAPVLDPAELERLAGRHGAIEIRYDAGVLRLFREDRPRWPQGARLVPMSQDGLFSMEGTDDVRFRFTGGDLLILRPSAAPEVFPPTP